MQIHQKTPLIALALTLLLAAAVPGWTQQTGTAPGATPLTGSPGISPIPTPSSGTSATLQNPAPTYDPYASGSGSAAYSAPTLSAPPSGVYGTGVPGSTNTPYTYGQAPASPYGQTYPGYGTQSPPVLFPNGLFGQSQPSTASAYTNPLKMFQNFNMSFTWTYGSKNKSNELNTTDIYLSTTAAFPNFLWSGQPWYVSPGFGWHNWAGPWDTVPPAQGLPPRAYSAFLDLGWRSDPNTAFGAELGGRAGIFSDFSTTTSKSVRWQGLALLRYNLTPSLAIKGGVAYLDRVDVKMLPALGFLWTPNPHTRFDIFFPQPKLSTYVTTLGTRDVWWYLGGEYGGGSWTVTTDSNRVNPAVPNTYTKMDINDWRITLGLEFHPPGTGSASIGQRGAFVELGYVFDRQIHFDNLPAYDLNDTFMLRGGFEF